MDSDEKIKRWKYLIRCIKKHCLSQECDGCVFDGRKICFNLNSFIGNEEAMDRIQKMLGNEALDD